MIIRRKERTIGSGIAKSRTTIGKITGRIAKSRTTGRKITRKIASSNVTCCSTFQTLALSHNAIMNFFFFSNVVYIFLLLAVLFV